MKRLFITAGSLLVLGACAVKEEIQVEGGAYVNGQFVAYCSAEPAPILRTKEGFPIIDDQACIPEPEVLGITIQNRGDPGGPNNPGDPPPPPPPPPLPPECEVDCDDPPPPPEDPCEGNPAHV